MVCIEVEIQIRNLSGLGAGTGICCNGLKLFCTFLNAYLLLQSVGVVDSQRHMILVFTAHIIRFERLRDRVDDRLMR